jgi:hypothetical protein
MESESEDRRRSQKATVKDIALWLGHTFNPLALYSGTFEFDPNWICRGS